MTRSRASLLAWVARKRIETGQPFTVCLIDCYRKAIERAAREKDPFVKEWMGVQLLEDLEADEKVFNPYDYDDLNFAISCIIVGAREEMDKFIEEE